MVKTVPRSPRKRLFQVFPTLRETILHHLRQQEP